MPPKFSIITPTWNRADGRLERCIRSVQAQAFRDYEHIIVDDGSRDNTREIVNWFRETDEQIRYIQSRHVGRIQARNIGMKATCGKQFVWLDSDDALDPMYLATLDYHIQQEPTVQLWVVGAIYHGMIKDKKGRHLVPKYTKLREAWIPRVNSDGDHMMFFSGKVGTGMFVFSRWLYEQVGPFPDDWINHNHIADGIDEWLGLEPGTTGYGTDRKNRPRGHVGNPFGDDHAYFARCCQFTLAHPINACLYIQYIR